MEGREARHSGASRLGEGALHREAMKERGLTPADIRIGNLETPPVADGIDPVMSEVRPGFAGAPGHAKRLSAHGFRIVSVASNHIMDFGTEGLSSTFAALDAVGILHVAAGLDLDVARRPAIVEARGRRIAFLASAAEGAHSAPRKGPGAPPRRLDQILEDVAAALGGLPAAIASLHSGLVDSDYPRPEDLALAFPVAVTGKRAAEMAARFKEISTPLAAGELDGAEARSATARRTARHQWDVFRHHLVRGHVGILGRWIVRLRPRHFRLAARAVMARLRRG